MENVLELIIITVDETERIYVKELEMSVCRNYTT